MEEILQEEGAILAGSVYSYSHTLCPSGGSGLSLLVLKPRIQVPLNIQFDIQSDLHQSNP